MESEKLKILDGCCHLELNPKLHGVREIQDVQKTMLSFLRVGSVGN